MNKSRRKREVEFYVFVGPVGQAFCHCLTLATEKGARQQAKALKQHNRHRGSPVRTKLMRVTTTTTYTTLTR